LEEYLMNTSRYDRDLFLAGDDPSLPIEVRALRSTRACRALRPKMSLAQIDAALSAELGGKRRRSVVKLLVRRQCKLIRAARMRPISRVKPKPRRQKAKKRDYYVK
jgi:hypothetical protein